MHALQKKCLNTSIETEVTLKINRILFAIILTHVTEGNENKFLQEQANLSSLLGISIKYIKQSK